MLAGVAERLKEAGAYREVAFPPGDLEEPVERLIFEPTTERREALGRLQGIRPHGVECDGRLGHAGDAVEGVEEAAFDEELVLEALERRRGGCSVPPVARGAEEFSRGLAEADDDAVVGPGVVAEDEGEGFHGDTPGGIARF